MNDLKDPDIHIKLNITSKPSPRLFGHPLRANPLPGEEKKELHFYYMTKATEDGNIRIETNFKMRK